MLIAREFGPTRDAPQYSEGEGRRPSAGRQDDGDDAGRYAGDTGPLGAALVELQADGANQGRDADFDHRREHVQQSKKGVHRPAGWHGSARPRKGERGVDAHSVIVLILAALALGALCNLLASVHP